MDKRKLSKIPRPCATQRMINDAKQLESMNHMVTAELIEDKKILLLNFFRIKSLAGGNTEAEFRTFLSHEDYITQDLKTSKTKWYHWHRSPECGILALQSICGIDRVEKKSYIK